MPRELVAAIRFVAPAWATMPVAWWATTSWGPRASAARTGVEVRTRPPGACVSRRDRTATGKNAGRRRPRSSGSSATHGTCSTCSTSSGSRCLGADVVARSGRRRDRDSYRLGDPLARIELAGLRRIGEPLGRLRIGVLERRALRRRGPWGPGVPNWS